MTVPTPHIPEDEDDEREDLPSPEDVKHDITVVRLPTPMDPNARLGAV